MCMEKQSYIRPMNTTYVLNFTIKKNEVARKTDLEKLNEKNT